MDWYCHSGMRKVVVVKKNLAITTLKGCVRDSPWFYFLISELFNEQHKTAADIIFPLLYVFLCHLHMPTCSTDS